MLVLWGRAAEVAAGERSILGGNLLCVNVEKGKCKDRLQEVELSKYLHFNLRAFLISCILKVLFYSTTFNFDKVYVHFMFQNQNQEYLIFGSAICDYF